MKLNKLLTFDNQHEAYLAYGKLKDEDIDCFLQNEYFSNLLPNYHGMLGSGIDLIVNEADVKKAKSVLNNYFHLNNDTCPICGSENIIIKLHRNKFSKIIIVLLSLFSFIPFGNINPKKICKECKTEF